MNTMSEVNTVLVVAIATACSLNVAFLFIHLFSAAG
jgi:hypothetical protein